MNKFKAFYVAHREAIAYLFFGGLTTLVSILSFAALSRLLTLFLSDVLALNIANLLSLLISITFAYVTNRRYVFQSKAKGRAVYAEVAAFFAGRTFTLLLDMGLMNLLVTVWHVWDIGAKGMVTLMVILLNYLIAKRWVFKKRPGTSNDGHDKADGPTRQRL